MVEYSGHKLTIRYCEQPPPDASASWQPSSWQEALDHVSSKRHARITAQMAARRQLLATKGQLRSPDHWNTESDLPNGKPFYALKAGKIRAYGWFSVRHKSVFYISHFAFKKGPKLAGKDERRVIANWRQIEE